MPTEILEELLRSKSFLEWSLNKPEPRAPRAAPKNSYSFMGESFSYQGHKYTNLIVNERHYAVAEVAEQWGISPDLVRDTFKDEPGVLRFVRPGTRLKRGYSTIRIPESVLVRVHTRLTSGR